MWSSMTSSMQLAQECLKQESPNSAENAQPLEGIERFAQTIDSSKHHIKIVIYYHIKLTFIFSTLPSKSQVYKYGHSFRTCTER